jgi:hypothetical protein
MIREICDVRARSVALRDDGLRRQEGEFVHILSRP